MNYKLRKLGVVLAGLAFVGLITFFFLNQPEPDMATRIQQQLERDYPWVTVGNVYHFCHDQPECSKTAAILIVLPQGVKPSDEEIDRFNIEALNLLYEFSVDTDISLAIAFAVINPVNPRFAHVVSDRTCKVMEYENIIELIPNCMVRALPGNPVAVPMIAE